MDKKNSFKYDTLEVFLFLWKKKIPIIIITILGIITSIIVSLTIEEKFKSEVILFPATTGSISGMVLTSNISKTDLLKFGEDEDLERILQVLNSNYIRDRIIEKYNLIEHYDIEKNSKFPKTALYKKFNSNVKYQKTPYQSIQIIVLDKDPIMASEIANNIALLIDTVMNEMQKTRALQAYRIVKKEYKKQQDYIASLEDSLEIIRKLGVLDYYLEVDRYSEAYGKSFGENKLNSNNKKLFEAEFENLAEYGDVYNTIKDITTYEHKRLWILHNKLLEAKINAQENIPHKYIVNPAQPAEKKSYPVRWIIVVISTIATFAFSIFTVLAIDFIKDFKKKLKNN